ncbi:MAG: hypothetical protein ACRDMH_06995 [Solirubrobacterales bacterium]
MRTVADDQDFAGLRAAADGLLYNDFVPRGDPAYNVLHSAGCRELARANLSVPKLFFESLDEAVDYLNRERGAEGIGWKRCGTCGAAPSSLPPRPSASRVAPPLPRQASEPPCDGEARPFLVRRRGTTVEAWSPRRLQYQPRGWQLCFRDKLREAVSELGASDGELLHGRYLSLTEEACDAENALIYNVYPRYFERSALHGLRFERAFVSPPPVPESDVNGDHYCAYGLTPIAGDFFHWNRGTAIARVECDGCGALSGSTPVARVWRAVKSAHVTPFERAGGDDDRFCLSVRLASPDGAASNPAAVVKPLFDGLICALHFHNDPSTLDEIAGPIAASLGMRREQTARLLSDPEFAVLGGRKVAWPRMDGVQWNPADDRCLAGELIPDRSLPGPRWSFSADLYRLE